LSAALQLSVNGVELKCEYGSNFDSGRYCKIGHADLSLKTIGASFIFSATLEQNQFTEWIWFDSIGRVAHLPRILIKEFPKLYKLWIMDSDIPILKNNFFKPEFSKLRHLELSGNRIQIIEKNAFRHLPDLGWIYLQRNEIRSLPAKLFKKIRKLRVIELGSNKIKVIPPDTFKNLNQLEEVDLGRNECITQKFGCYHRGCSSNFDYTELERSLQPCYENHDKSLNLLNKGEYKYA
jgi:Leucine-rich repeat (LRR) protein